ncbi:MAG TPA: endonuclease/exonuclease/phosphatase family protein [Actinomycetota bacterium]|jgi:endonuclease/exonuclease/phosphatase family metal-dependent hydrolase
MPEFPKPTFSYEYDPDAQIDALREYEQNEPGRDVPAKAANRLLIATWNIANLEAHDRRDKDHRLMAEILRWFDVIALQEVRDNLGDLLQIQSHLPASYELLFTDPSGNDERMTFVSDASKVKLLQEVGEVAPAPASFRYIKLPGITQRFDGFDRNPYLATFQAGTFTFSLVNVHLYFGTDSTYSKNRRSLEAYAIARWADLRRNSDFALTKDIIPLGDFNLPLVQPGDEIYEALTARGLQLPPHSTQVGGATVGQDTHYDQVAFFPGDTQNDFTGQSGVFDFDGAIFAYLWDTRPLSDFYDYVRYYMSDHRPLWAEFRI